MLQHLTNTLELAAEMLCAAARSEMSTALKTDGFDTDRVWVFFDHGFVTNGSLWLYKLQGLYSKTKWKP